MIRALFFGEEETGDPKRPYKDKRITFEELANHISIAENSIADDLAKHRYSGADEYKTDIEMQGELDNDYYDIYEKIDRARNIYQKVFKEAASVVGKKMGQNPSKKQLLAYQKFK